MPAVEAIEARALEDVRANPLDIVSFPYIIDFDPSVLFSSIVADKNPREGARYG
jgi:hypothetical protein